MVEAGEELVLQVNLEAMHVCVEILMYSEAAAADDDPATVLHPATKVDAADGPWEARFTPEKDGILFVNIDNSFSWMRGKKLHVTLRKVGA